MSTDFQALFPSKICLDDSPQLRVICFHHAGGTEHIYTNRGTDNKPNPQPLVDFCKDEGIELIACQLPGRGSRLREQRFTNMKKCALEVFRILNENNKISDGVPYVFVAHSVGCWLTYELCHLIRSANLQQPSAVYLSSMISPDTPENMRPWKKSAGLSDPEFRVECAGWAVNEEVFSSAAWEMFEPLLRDDFRLFDEYEFTHANDIPFKFPAVIWRPENDQRVSLELQKNWEKVFSSVSFRTVPNATHAFVYNNTARVHWQKDICSEIDGILLELTY